VYNAQDLLANTKISITCTSQNTKSTSV